MYNFYNDFVLAFSNTNPIAKLAALDLIKYACLCNNAVLKEDEDGFDYEYSPTDLEDALEIRDKRTIVDY